MVAINQEDHTMQFSIGVMELIDLQQALRRSDRTTKQFLEFADRNGLTDSVKVYKQELERSAELYQQLEQLFDKHYPASSSDAA